MEEESSLRKMLGWALPPGPPAEELEAMGLTPTYENAIRLQLVKKAAGGDFSAAKYILAAAGEEAEAEGNPLEEVSTEELRRMLES